VAGGSPGGFTAGQASTYDGKFWVHEIFAVRADLWKIDIFGKKGNPFNFFYWGL
jgi:hypothetical protein